MRMQWLPSFTWTASFPAFPAAIMCDYLYPLAVKKGDRIAQLVLERIYTLPVAEVEVSDRVGDLSSLTDRHMRTHAF